VIILLLSSTLLGSPDGEFLAKDFGIVPNVDRQFFGNKNDECRPRKQSGEPPTSLLSGISHLDVRGTCKKNGQRRGAFYFIDK